MIGLLADMGVRKQPIIALHFESETVLKFYNLGGRTKHFHATNTYILSKAVNSFFLSEVVDKLEMTHALHNKTRTKRLHTQTRI